MIEDREDILERDAEFAEVSSKVREIQRRGCVLLIEGPAGIGKTTVLRRVAEDAPEDLRVVQARGTELEQELAFAVVLALLAPAVEAAGPEVFEGAAGVARPLFQTGSIDESVDELGILHGLHWLTANLAEARPMMLCVDDLQWADHESLRFLRYLGERIEELPIVVLASVRTGEDGSQGDEITGLASGPAASTLRPATLSIPAITRIAEDVLGPEVPDDLPEACWKASGGVPLFAVELLRAHGEDDAPATPEAAVRLVSRRIANLPDPAPGLVGALTTLGEGTNAAEVSELTGLPLDEVLPALDLLAEAELTQTGNPVAFRHPLLRDAAANATPTGERARLHLAAARMLRDAAPARAAAQLAAIEPPCPTNEAWAAALLHAAAVDARRRGGNSEAVRYLTRALEEPADKELRRQVLLDLGRLEAHARNPDTLIHLKAAKALASDPLDRGRIALVQGDALFHFGALEDCSSICLEAIADLDGQDRELALALEATSLNADALRGARRERPAEMEAEVSSASTPGERAALVHVVADLAATGRDTAAQVRQLGQRALGGGALLEEVGPSSPVYIYAGTALAWADDYDEVLKLTESGFAVARGRGSRMGISYSLALNAGARLRAGDIDGCESAAALVVEELAEADAMAYAISVAWLIEALVEKGEIESARQVLDTSGLGGELPALGTIAFLMLARGALMLAEGAGEEALAEFASVGELAEQSRYTNPAALAWRSRRALALLEAGRNGEAAEAAAEELQLARAFGAGRAIAISLQACARVTSEPGAKIALLEEALIESERAGAQLEHARALVDLGIAQAETGDSGARGTLELGMDQAFRSGATGLVDRAMDSLRATGARPRRPLVRGVGSLTRQERTVAGLAAQGMGNREIAEELFVTRRTVETHLSSAYRKLSIESRTELKQALGSAPTERL